MLHKLYIYGAGGHAKVVASTARLLGYEIAGFVVDASLQTESSFCGSPVITPEQLPTAAAIHIAFGNCARRNERGMELLAQGYRMETLIHPSSSIAPGVKIGKGCYIGALACIDPECTIGDFVIVNNHAAICHETVIGSGTHICPGTTIAGTCVIGSSSWIGLGCRVIEKITIGNNVLLGAGSVVIRNIPDNAKAFGVPARVR